MNTTNIDTYLRLGSHDINWYQECEQTFTNLFGVEQLKLVTKIFAATSINSSLKSNITLFRRVLYEIQNGLPTGRYLPVMKMQIERIKNGEPLSGRKINNFANAMSGDASAVVVDIWLMRAFDLDRKYYRNGSGSYRSGGASPKVYDIIEEYCKEKAYSLGIEPRQVSAMLWSSTRLKFTGVKTTRYTHLLEAKFNNLFNVI